MKEAGKISRLFKKKRENMYQNILFDLDGTLTNSELGITNSVAYALEKFGIEVQDKKELTVFIGPPLKYSFEVYKGIREILSSLKQADKKLIVATSKPEKFSIQILKHFDLYDYFDFVAGATMDGSRSKKADVIGYALEKTKIKNLPETIMVGDREHDIIGAQIQKIESIGVLYGFGTKEELEKAGATFIVKDVCELENLLLFKKA